MVSICEKVRRCTSSQCSQWRLLTDSILLLKHRCPGHVRRQCVPPGTFRQPFLSPPKGQNRRNNSFWQQCLLYHPQLPPFLPWPSCLPHSCSRIAATVCAAAQWLRLGNWPRLKITNWVGFFFFVILFLIQPPGLYRRWELDSNPTPWTQSLAVFILRKMLFL